jgi:SRSO17 transposase
MRQIWIKAALAATLLASVIAAPASAGPSGRDFGQHHACVAQTTGLNGTLNPGVHHRGYSNVMEKFSMCSPSEGRAQHSADRAR